MEVPESEKYHGGYDPSDPPQGNHWCSECSQWDDECTCEEPEETSCEAPQKNSFDN